ncbi:single-stranded DNA-binding protein [Schaalia sp. 19OD2882]|uniref:single-stranded DNA-binding protein n=1 Tax=Schaalia sp. 19OD2882 TaxID=2794089 RepID=UPI001C1EC0D5|nr:single-stranded DNA-binding protein [Schaalia sp. 19OD2882]QWW20413.1 single-stranded DNA-binding protein [Schaalia sp. 19OD2882]
MSDMPSITLRGRVGTDLVSGRTPKDHVWVRFRLAVPQWRIDDRGNFVETGTMWYSVKAWDRLARNALRSLTKGQKVIVVGRPGAQAWQDKEGEVRTALVISAQALGHDLSAGTSHFFAAGRPEHVHEEPPAAHAPLPGPTVDPHTGEILREVSCDEDAMGVQTGPDAEPAGADQEGSALQGTPEEGEVTPAFVNAYAS